MYLFLLINCDIKNIESAIAEKENNIFSVGPYNKITTFGVKAGRI